ncbi:endonuclease SmrB [Alteromonas oceanisediminis]|uniref:endonuclease SmrB n=1 Tax=Alteromonas oceanisediminis TaxID=2836180 RepID=UPI0028F3EA51|nr:endonuclease SmrB [Alteromonas oceanisediminis]
MEDDDWSQFKKTTPGLVPLAPDDKIVLTRTDNKAMAKQFRRKAISSAIAADRKRAAEFAFSDDFQAHFDAQGPLKFVNHTKHSSELKRLRRGDYVPEFLLDLHGLSRDESKREIAALLAEAHKQHARCVCIVHGIGSGVLRQQVPHWLVQHPNVIAFHQATLEWGGQGALLVLIATNDPKLGD